MKLNKKRRKNFHDENQTVLLFDFRHENSYVVFCRTFHSKKLNKLLFDPPQDPQPQVNTQGQLQGEHLFTL